MSSQINSLHHSHGRVLCPEKERGPIATVGSDIDKIYPFPTCPLVPGMPIEKCGANVPLMSTPQYVHMGWNCLHIPQTDDTCNMCFCVMFRSSRRLQDMVYALYEIYFWGGDAGRVIGEKMLGDIPLDQFVVNPDPLSGVGILPVQRPNERANINTTPNEPANINTTKVMAWDIQTCLRDNPVTGLNLTDEERKDVIEANPQRWSSCYAQRLMERKDVEEANLQRWSSELVQQRNLLPSIAFTKLTHLSYTTHNLYRSPSDWAALMVLYAKAAGIPSNSQLFKVWVRFDPSLRRDIPMPNWTTRMIDFLEHLDEMYPIWLTRKQDTMVFP